MECSVYTKEELKNSERFYKRRDLVEALLENDREYSLQEAEEIVKNFMEGSV